MAIKNFKVKLKSETTFVISLILKNRLSVKAEWEKYSRESASTSVRECHAQ